MIWFLLFLLWLFQMPFRLSNCPPVFLLFGRVLQSFGIHCLVPLQWSLFSQTLSLLFPPFFFNNNTRKAHSWHFCGLHFLFSLLSLNLLNGVACIIEPLLLLQKQCRNFDF